MKKFIKLFILAMLATSVCTACKENADPGPEGISGASVSTSNSYVSSISFDYLNDGEIIKVELSRRDLKGTGLSIDYVTWDDLFEKEDLVKPEWQLILDDGYVKNRESGKILYDSKYKHKIEGNDCVIYSNGRNLDVF